VEPLQTPSGFFTVVT